MRFCKDCIHYSVCERHAGDIPDSIIEDYNHDVIELLCHDFKEKQKHGRWLPKMVIGERVWECSECMVLGSPRWKVCPVCESVMDLPRITDQTMDAIKKLGERGEHNES